MGMDNNPLIEVAKKRGSKSKAEMDAEREAKLKALEEHQTELAPVITDTSNMGLRPMSPFYAQNVDIQKAMEGELALVKEKYHSSDAQTMLRAEIENLIAYTNYMRKYHGNRQTLATTAAYKAMIDGLDKLHKQIEGTKITVESKVVHDLQNIRGKIGEELLEQQKLKDLKNKARVIEANVEVEESINE